jgi:GTP diphosphokinase / guanosine-3',5'-bis(diphosphate) 3'-diphosphatase
MLIAVREELEEEIKKFTPDEATKLSSALELAEKTHEGQYRKPSVETPDHRDPYIIHPMRVALILLQELGIRHSHVIAAAILHDVVEDSDGKVTVDEIAQKFGDEVAEIVALLSKPPYSSEMARYEQLAIYHNNIAAASVWVRSVKLADRLDNIRESLRTNDSAFQIKYLNETREIYIPLAAETDPFFYSKIAEICNRLDQMLKDAGH